MKPEWLKKAMTQGAGLSGPTMRALAKFGQEQGSQEYGNAYGRYMQSSSDKPRFFTETPVCCICGKSVDLEYGPDPYEEDIHNDDTPVWQCTACRQEAGAEI